MGKGKICENMHYVPKFEAFMLNDRNDSKSSHWNTASNDVTSRLFLNFLNCFLPKVSQIANVRCVSVEVPGSKSLEK